MPDANTIETAIPGRLDRLPWSRFHWMVVIGLGTVWILDGLEVTMVGSVATQLTLPGSGITISVSQIGVAAAAYVAGACLGALVFGQLTDRFGRKKLFLITLGVYIVATVASAFAASAWYVFAENPLALEHQIEVIEQALVRQGPIERRRRARLVGARNWGPGRFRLALQEALREGRARRLLGGVIAPVQR